MLRPPFLMIPAVLASLLVLGGLAPARAHDVSVGIGGRSLVLDTRTVPAKNKFLFTAKNEIFIAPDSSTDPASTGSAVLVGWTGSGGTGAGRTELIQLDPTRWLGLGNPAGSKGYKYLDKTQAAGGIKKILFKPGNKGGLLKILAKGYSWSWPQGGPHDAVWVHFAIEDEWYCAEFSGATAKKNEDGLFKATNALAPDGGCPEQTCGNGVQELGEECDDGNLVDDDGCSNTCETPTNPECEAGEFDSTFEAIQSVVFDGYDCSNATCHGGAAPSGNLNLTAGSAYANILSVASTISPAHDRVVPGEPALSVLYDKLQAGTNGGLPAFGGSSMPVGPIALTAEHLQAVWEWIRAGAPEDTVVAGTADLLATCLPDPEPNLIPPLDPPGAGVGVQFRQTPWPLPAQSEDEICMATYYDLTGTGLVPASEQFDCGVTTHNPTGKCFRWHRSVLAQDSMSHHSIIEIYPGTQPLTASHWGGWTYKFQDQTNPLEGTPCDPTTVDPATGYNPGCSSQVISGITCSSLGGGVGVGGGSFAGSQEPYAETEFADGVFAPHPMAGVILWNSHAFNLTGFDSTMSQYLNMYLAGPADQLNQAQAIFQASSIFVMNPSGIPAFETREYCANYVAPRGSTVFNLGSHTHRTGVRFRIWAPPNSNCTAGSSCGPGTQGPLIYTSTDYADPLSLDVDMHFPSSLNSTNRRFRFCSLYDNGSTPSSPEVKRHPNNAGTSCPGRVCFAGPSKGASCTVDSQCDSSPGAGDGECNACTVLGGFTTMDEMFILTGNYY